MTTGLAEAPITAAPRTSGQNALAAALAQFDAAAEHLGLDPDLRAVLRVPQRELTVNFPVKMDDGSVRVFSGYRVQHNAARGPAKGGLRFHPQADLDDVRTVAQSVLRHRVVTNFSAEAAGRTSQDMVTELLEARGWNPA